MDTPTHYVLRSRIRRARRLERPETYYSGEVNSTFSDVSDFSAELADKLQERHGMRGFRIAVCIGEQLQNIARHQHQWDEKKKIPAHVFGYTGRIYATLTGEPGPAYDPRELWARADEKTLNLASNCGRGTIILKENVDCAWYHFDPESHGYIFAFNLKKRPERKAA